MAITRLTEAAKEGSTYPITVAFYDENDAPVTPESGLVWSLRDGNGNVINGRENVAIASASSIRIVLFGADLAVTETSGTERVVTVEGTYMSDLHEDPLPLVDEVRSLLIIWWG